MWLECGCTWKLLAAHPLIHHSHSPCCAGPAYPTQPRTPLHTEPCRQCKTILSVNLQSCKLPDQVWLGDVLGVHMCDQCIGGAAPVMQTHWSSFFFDESSLVGPIPALQGATCAPPRIRETTGSGLWPTVWESHPVHSPAHTTGAVWQSGTCSARLERPHSLLRVHCFVS